MLFLDSCRSRRLEKLSGGNTDMRLPMKVALVATRNIWDTSGQQLPIGSYYFLIRQTSRGRLVGDLRSGDLVCEYSFAIQDVIEMMAASQSRLHRRLGVRGNGVPDIPSPVSSPISTRPQQAMRIQRNRARPATPICTICLDSINRSAQRSLDCNHTFHRVCINRWLHTRSTCPVCRRPSGTLPPVAVPRPPRPRRHSRYAVVTRRREYRRHYASNGNLIS